MPPTVAFVDNVNIELTRKIESSYRLEFDAQSEIGQYDLSIGPDINTLDGTPMDQNQNLNPAETEDVYQSTFEVSAGGGSATSEESTVDLLSAATDGAYLQYNTHSESDSDISRDSLIHITEILDDLSPESLLNQDDVNVV